MAMAGHPAFSPRATRSGQ